MIVKYGQLNTTALSRADLYIQIVPPQTLTLNGVPTNLGGVVGAASFGPVGAPVKFSGVTDGTQTFGPMANRASDLMTAVNNAVKQGQVGNYVGVRVSDGTDLAATASLGSGGSLAFWTALANAINSGAGTPRGPSALVVATPYANRLGLTAKYTGSLGSQIAVSLTTGGKAGTYRLIINAPGFTPETFDNLAAGIEIATPPFGSYATDTITVTTNPAAGATLTIGGTTVAFVASGTTPVGNQVVVGANAAATAAALAAFLNASTDNNLSRANYSVAGAVVTAIATAIGLSGIVIQTSSGSGLTVATPILMGGTTGNLVSILAGGTDGASNLNSALLVGSDTLPRTGMYALRGTGVSVAMLADCADWGTFSLQDSFGQDEGCYMVTTTASGDTIANAVAQKAAFGIDTPWVKIMFGDWVTILDTTNDVERLVSPQAFAFGKLINLAPHMSSLNKPILGLVSTQKSAANQIYANGDIDQLDRAGFDLICNPVPGGSYFGCRTGRNASSDVADTGGDNYTRMTDYIAATMNAGLGKYIGELQSRRANDNTRRKAKATIDAFLQTMADTQPDPMIDSFLTVLDLSNNSITTIGGGYMFAYVKVVYMSIVRYFVINLEGGQTVTITAQATNPITGLAA